MMDISIKDCRRALQFALAHHRKGFPFIAQRSWIVVTEPLEVRGKNWISGELVLRRPEKVAFTAAARKLIADEVIKVNPWAFPAEISSQECLKAIEFAGELSITHLGETLHVTELVVRNSRWWCGDCRLSPAKQRCSPRPPVKLSASSSTSRPSPRPNRTAATGSGARS